MPSNIGIVATVVDRATGTVQVAILARQTPGEKLHYVQGTKQDDPVHLLRERLNGVFPHKGFCQMSHAGGLQPEPLPHFRRYGSTVDGRIAQYVHVHTTLEHWNATFAAADSLPRHKLVPASQAQVRCPKETRAIKAALSRVYKKPKAAVA